MTPKDKSDDTVVPETSPAQTESAATKKPVDRARFKGSAAKPPKGAPHFPGPKGGNKPQGLRKSHGRGR
ncbi:hypothetical protein BH10PSE7_BH10PSE7_28780 [soil metagenome]